MPRSFRFLFERVKEYDVVRIKETVLRTPLFGVEPIEIRAGWEGTITDYAETDAPSLEIAAWRGPEEERVRDWTRRNSCRADSRAHRANESGSGLMSSPMSN
jgi:hypothetical protein